MRGCRGSESAFHKQWELILVAQRSQRFEAFIDLHRCHVWKELSGKKSNLQIGPLTSLRPNWKAVEVARMQRQEFGCELCWPAGAGAAWEARDGLTRLKELIDESHFIVAILVCPRCDQRYVSIFTELIDWEDGEDPQYWTLMPITEAEANGLIQQETSLNKISLNALGHGRRSLRRDHPKAGPPRVFWGSGILIGPHD